MSVIEAWGRSIYGGDASSVDLTNVASITCGGRACVAVKNDRAAETWGWADGGGNASSVDLTNIANAMCGGYACAALRYLIRYAMICLRSFKKRLFDLKIKKQRFIQMCH